MNVLLVSMKYDYGEKSRGLSLTQHYFEAPIRKLVDSVNVFDFMTVFHERGRVSINQDLLETVLRERPDVTVIVPFTDQFIPEVIDEINKHTITLGYFFDDTWRIDYSQFWANHFTFVTTSDINGYRKWREAGCSNFIYSPFGCNQEVFSKKVLPKIYDVSFVGQYHPFRAWCLRQLRQAGLNVNAWGYGWPEGHLDLDSMVDVFNQSRINLNLSNNESWDARYIFLLSRPLRETLKVIRNSYRSARRTDAKTKEMVKARHFEINACGGFQLSYYTEGLERHYKIGEEIAIYESVDTLVDKARYYLKHEGEREDIARRGYERSLFDHTMEKRFTDLFDSIGLKNWCKT